MTLQERYDTMVEYWLLGFNTTVPILLLVGATIVSAAVAAWRRDVRPLIVVLALLSLLALVDATTLVRAPKFVAGLYRLAPFLIFAVLPRANDDASPPWFGRSRARIVRELRGPGLPRHGHERRQVARTAAAAPTGSTAGRVRSRRDFGHLASARLSNRLIGACGAVLVAVSLTIHLGSTLPAWVVRTGQDADRLGAIANAEQRVLVADDMFTAQQLLPLDYRRIILLADNDRQATALGAALDREKIPSVLLVSRHLNPGIELPPLKAVWTSARYRFLIQVWRR